MITSDFGHLLGAFRLAAASIVRWCLVYGQLTFLADAIPASRQVTLRRTRKQRQSKSWARG